MTDNESYSGGVRSQAAPDDPPHTHLDPGDNHLSPLLKHRWPTLGGVVAVVLVGVVSRVLVEDLELYVLAGCAILSRRDLAVPQERFRPDAIRLYDKPTTREGGMIGKPDGSGRPRRLARLRNPPTRCQGAEPTVPRITGNDHRKGRRLAMRRRSGNFWDGVEGRAPKPRAAATLGWEFIDADVEEGTIEVSFAATEAFTNPMGEVLGGFLAAMLYDTVGPALLATLEPGQFISTMELKASFLRPVSPGKIVGSGRVAHRDGDLAFLEGFLSDLEGATVATATATARVINMDPSTR